jgi:hypothetical protein
VVDQSSALRAGEISSLVSQLTPSEETTVAFGEQPALVDADDSGWTPVTRRTSHTHRERSLSIRSNDINSAPDANNSSEIEYESTIDQAADGMSHEELQASVHRHEAIAAQFCARLARKAVDSYQEETSFGEITPECNTAAHSMSLRQLPCLHPSRAGQR